MVYICRRYKGTPRCDYDEVKLLKFFPINDLPSKISKPNILPLQKYLEYRVGRK
jgi:hypothetical protein